MPSDTELIDHLTGTGPPWTVTVSPRQWVVARASLSDRDDVRVIDVPGRESRTKTGFLAAVARALRFPEYFGHNWDALEECLRDLGWLQAPAYVIAVNEAEDLLVESGDDRRTFTEIVDAVAEHWAAHGRGVPFHVLLVTSSGVD